MQRRLFGAVLCLLLLPVFGTAQILWSTLRVAAFRPRSILLLGGLAVAMTTTDTGSLLAPNGVRPLGHMIPSCVGAIGVAVVWHGLRSTGLRTLWRCVR